MTYTLKDLENHARLNWGYYELQSRVVKTAEVKPDWASRSGKRGKWLVTDAGLAALIRIRELEQAGMSIDGAIERVISETSKSKEPAAKDPSLEVVHMLEREIEQLNDRIQTLEVEKNQLYSLLDRLITPALASKERGSRHWWQFWRS
jgi:DNA-binding transcriptional MerR regulator